MMLRVVLFEIYRRYRLRLAPGATVTKNTVVTTKPAGVPIVRVPREQDGVRDDTYLLRDRPPAPRRPRGAELGRADGDPGDERVSPSRHRVRQQLRREQGAGGALRRAEPVPRLHERCRNAERARRRAAAHGSLAARRHVVHLYVEPAVERDCVQDDAGADDAGRRDMAELPLRRVGARQQPVERVPRLPALHPCEARRARRDAARGFCVRRRRLARLGGGARRLERSRLARAHRAVGRAAERGGGCARRGRAGCRGRARKRRLEHGDGDVVERRRPRTAGAARPRDPDERRRDRHRGGPRARLPGAAGERLAEADAAPRGRAAAGPRVHGGRPSRHLPEERRGAGRAARAVTSARRSTASSWCRGR